MAILEIIPEVAEELEAGLAGAEGEIGEASEVENEAVVNEAADSPALSENAQEAAASTLGQTVKDFSIKIAKTIGVEGAKAGLVWGIFYGLNQLLAKKSSKTGKRTALSVYLKQVETNFKKQGLTFNDEVKQETADAAVKLPWIDATK